MRRLFIVWLLALTGLILGGLTGCGVWPVMTEENGRRPHAMGKSDQVLLPWAPQPVHLSEEFGLAYRQALENQIVNPAASNNLDPMLGSADSRAQQHNLARYQLMFQNPPYSDLTMRGGSGSSAGTGAGGTNK